MTTAKLVLPGADLPSTALLLSDLPFKKANLLFHASADSVTEEAIDGSATETRVAAFLDLDSGTSYSVGTAHRIGKRATVNGLQVVDVSLQASVATVARNYQFPAAFIQGRSDKIVMPILFKPDLAAASVQTVWGASANANNATTNSSALFNLEMLTPTSMQFRAEAMVDGLINSDVSVSLTNLPTTWIFAIATMDVANKLLTLAIDGVGEKSIAMPDLVAPTPSTLTVRNGPFRQVAPSPTNTVVGNMFTGRFRRVAGFTASLGATQKAQLIAAFRAECRVLNGN